MPHRSSPSASWRARKYRYTPTATRCTGCNKLFYPLREICPKCKNKTKEEVLLSGIGVLESFTTIHHPPAGFEEYTPYVIGIIKLDEGPRISAQLVNRPEECKIGVRVQCVFRKYYKDGESGLNFYGIKFRVI